MALRIIRPLAQGNYSQWTLAIGASKPLAVDTGDPIFHDEDAAYLITSGGDRIDSFTTQGHPPGLVSITSFKVGARFRGGNSAVVDGAVFVRLNGVDGAQTQYSFTQGATYATFGPAAVAKPGGGSFGPGDFTSALELCVRGVSGAADVIVTSLWGELEYPSQISSPREVGSRRLRLRRLPGGVIEANVPSLVYLDHELGTIIDISHPHLPSTDGTGAGVKLWQRWPCVLIGRETRELDGTETLFLRDLREYLTTFWDVGKSLKSAVTYAEGMARLDAGNLRSWIRASIAYVVNPAGIIASVGTDSEKLDRDGEMLESASTNEVIQSGFKNGSGNTFTGWTKSGEGSNGSTITEEPVPGNFFDATVNPRAIRFTAGYPTIHVADLQAQGTATRSFSANAIVRFGIWHRDSITPELIVGSYHSVFYAIQRAFDSNWWRDSDQTWQVAKTWNAVPAPGGPGQRHHSKQINVGANATTLTPFVGIPTSGGVAGQINQVGHVQIEEKNFTTSTILTETVAVTRAADKLTITNPSNAPAWPPARGTFRVKVVPEWDAADVATVNKTLAYLEHDANNYDWLFYDGVNARWVYRRVAGGVTYSAVKAHSPVAGATYNIAARWTSDYGELNLANRTLSVFVDGVKGTDVTAAALVVVTNATLEFGSKSGAENFDGNLWAFEVTQQALPDLAVARY